MHNHHTAHMLVHAAKHALETETGKKAVKSAGTALLALAPTVVALATPLAPVVLIGALGYGLYCVFKA